MLNSISSCRDFLAIAGPEAIAQQTRQDQALCQKGRIPSVLAMLLPPPESRQAGGIAKYLLPGSPIIPQAVANLQYRGIIEGIKNYLMQMDYKDRRQEMSPLPRSGDVVLDEPSPELIDEYVSETETAQNEGQGKARPISLPEALAKVFTSNEIEAALRCSSKMENTDSMDACLTVMAATSVRSQSDPTRSNGYSSKSEETGQNKLQDASSSDDAIVDVRQRLCEDEKGDLAISKRLSAKEPHQRRKKKCYICLLALLEPHNLYPALCKPCGRFNLAESNMSSPSNLGRYSIVNPLTAL